MNFTLFKLTYDSFPFHQSTLKKTWKLFSKKDEDVSLFSSNKISEDSYHVVFHIADEYIGGSKKGGEEINLPFSQYINTFLINQVFFVETTKKNYVNLIKEFIIDEFNVNPSPVNLDNDTILSILTKTSGFIKKLEYIDVEGDDFELESLHVNNFPDRINGTIDYVNFLSDLTFVSLNKNGKLSINSTDEEELLNVIEVVSSAIN